MAIEFDIQVQNGIVKITVGESQIRSAGGSVKGGSSPTDPTGHTGGGGPHSGGGCCGPVVVGPIVIDGSSVQPRSGQGGSSPTDPTGHTGGGGPKTGPSSPTDPSGHTGGGGPSSGSGCSCPVVIGPIVIGGCSSQGAASSAGFTGSKAVTVNPPADTKTIMSAQAFIVQTQLASNWCWAAVAVSINAFLDPPSPVAGLGWTQASLATQLLGKKLPGCSAMPMPNSCNKPERLDVALTITRNMMPDGALTNQHLTFDCIQNWVKVQLPLGARITWFGGGAHFIALDGCKVMSDGQRLVHVQDPSFSPASSPGLWDYDALVEDYLEQGYWSDTYLVTANPNP